MGTFKYIPPPRGDDRSPKKATASPRGLPGPPEARQRNVEAVLSLGSTRYLRMHSHVYAIAPVSFKLGQRLLEKSISVLTSAKRLALGGKQEDTLVYYEDLASLAKMMWPHMRPTGRTRQWMKRFGLMRNPLLSASEFEIKDVCDFFLQGRTRSSVQPLSDPNPARETRTS